MGAENKTVRLLFEVIRLYSVREIETVFKEDAMRTSRVLIAALGLFAGACSVQAAEVGLPPFYQNLASISPNQPLGTVVAKEAVVTQIPGAEAWRIAYVSSDATEKKTLSSALVIAPTGAMPAGGRPIVAWAHGTTGIAQNCGPSQVPDPAQDLNEYNLIGGTSWTDFGFPAATQFIKNGYVLVATDYQGLGAGGIHQYANAATNARDLINSARAVGSMGLSGDNKNVVANGWSQGGGAVIAAASLKDYIAAPGSAFDGVNFVGFVALAPQDVEVLIPAAAENDQASAQKVLSGLADSFSDNVFNFTHYAMVMWALKAAYPELQLNDIFTDDGAKTLTEIFSKKCMHAGADTLNFNFGNNYKSLLKPQAGNAQAWVKRLRDASVMKDPPVAPVVIYYGNKDVTNPPVMGQLYQAQKCAVGGNVARVMLPGDQNHFTTPPVSQQFFVPWTEDRFARKPLESGCPAEPPVSLTNSSG